MKSFPSLFLILALLACTKSIDTEKLRSQVSSLDLTRGDIALCTSGKDEFGQVAFAVSCSEEVKADFNLATALLHSFEYPEAEKVYARIMEKDPKCLMAYWGAAMCNFHPLWEPPNENDLKKGSAIITLGRSVVTDPSARESRYLETIATIYDGWHEQDHKARLLKFEEASAKLHQDFPDDNEAAIFHALAMRAAADPRDKTFEKQKRAGEILNTVLAKDPKHPGVAHYIIHVYDYPELAQLGLKSAREYASLAPASAHALHMPSHIFTRLGLWDESIQSNSQSVEAAKCYAENAGIKGHWDEELHGLDYLMYAYLQRGDEANARTQFEYFKTINEVFPMSSKDAYSFGAVPARYAVERKDWKSAAQLELAPASFSWDKYYWERSNTDFARLLGAAHLGDAEGAKKSLDQLKKSYDNLVAAKESYKASLVEVQVKAGEAWVAFAEANKSKAVQMMNAAADLEDKIEKHPVTPGPLVPARELLGDLYMVLGATNEALHEYESALLRQPNRFNAINGAAEAATKAGNTAKARMYYDELLKLAPSSGRAELAKATAFASRQ
ncbi:tetratricopeptide repeat protein [Chryseolinea sp. T2]|uniref:tetratricopeptide repeat protein n=1 Tax=Chryseolinea sp. T2 TaxID=3129255 RepID=UPI00307693D7